jgi:hypothetical protein
VKNITIKIYAIITTLTKPKCDVVIIIPIKKTITIANINKSDINPSHAN